ncbi:MAG: 50S ribosomal protein L2 [Candidatus Pacebacteria bacterium]|nr:50S ribosomal protein L2 [Candidatus Paceibacterota bacterium]
MKKIFTKKEPEKRLLIRIKRRAGRAKSGRITVRHQGGGAKRLYRIIDFGQKRKDEQAKVIAIEYDPYRTSYLILLEYPDGKKVYRLALDQIKVGDSIVIAEKAENKIGNRMKLINIPLGVMVCNVEMIPEKGGKIVRSAGASALILSHEGKYTHLKMPSKEIRKILSQCYATIGQISNTEHRYKKLRKAGQTRLMGKRPQVRGTVMSPRAHPHGGGEGKTPIGMPAPKTPWGKPARGVKTRRNKSTNKYIIQTRK